MNCVYVLRRDGVVFYVGTTSDPIMRLKEHGFERGWFDITLEVVEECSGKARHYRENYWIQKLSAEGHQLENVKGTKGHVAEPIKLPPKPIADKDLPKAYLRKKRR
jgi:predicted GIY-YIG superfamily endonuclease